MADENLVETGTDTGTSLLTSAGTSAGTSTEGADNAEAGKATGSGSGAADGKPANEGADKVEGKAEGDKTEGGKAGDKKPDPASQVPDKASGYDLKFDEATKVDTALLDSFRNTAKELGLTKGQAQKLGSMYEAHVSKAATEFQAAQAKALLEARQAWEAEIKKSPDFETDLANIQSALRQFGDKDLYDLLDQTNLGSHPKMWAFMAKVGKALAEPGFHGAGAGSGKTAAQVLYPGMN